METAHFASQLSHLRKREDKPCEYCGKTFHGLKVSRYCGESCKQKAKYRRHKKINREAPLSRTLGLSRPYDWSNIDIPEDVFMLLVLKGCYVPDIAACTAHFGVERMRHQLRFVDDDLTLKICTRQLNAVISAIEEMKS